MKFVMYHYVGFYNPNFPNLKFLDADDFQKQLDYFEENFGFVSKSKFIEAIRNKESPQGVVLTFDDGLKCHYEIVYKILKERGLWGIFYVNSLPLKEFKFLDVHLSHILTAISNQQIVFELLIEICHKGFLEEKAIKVFENYAYKNQEQNEYSLEIKKIINYYIKFENRTKVINEILSKIYPDFIINVSDYYLNVKEMIEMNKNGMLFGGHTVSHKLLSRLDIPEQEFEIIQDYNFLENVLEEMPLKTFCFPYGGEKSFNPNTINILNKEKFDFSLSVESRDVIPQDLLHNLQFLPRYDCNEFPYGKCRY